MNCLATTGPATRVAAQIFAQTGKSENAFATNAVIETILSRSAAKYYDPAASLSDDQIRDLVRIGTTAPTSFHLQNWRFIAVRTPEAKPQLRPIAWEHPAITEAAVTFIVCGQLADSSVIPQRLAPLVEAGVMPAKMVPEWENQIGRAN